MTDQIQETSRLKRIESFIRNSPGAILKGEFLLRLGVSRYFVHILYLFLLFGLVIWISLSIDTTLCKVENNKAIIKELEIVNSQKTFDVVSLRRRASVRQMLEDMGSVGRLHISYHAPYGL